MAELLPEPLVDEPVRAPGADAVPPRRKRGRKRTFLQDASSMLGSNFTALTIGILTSIVLNRSLGPELKGVLVAVLVYPSLVSSIGHLGIRQSTAHALGQRRFSDAAIVGSVVSLFWITSMIGVGLCIGVYALLGNPHFTLLMIALALASVPLGFMQSYSNGVMLGREMIRQFSRTRWISAVVSLFASCLFLLVFGWGINGAQLAGLLAASTVVVYALILAGRVAPLRPCWNPQIMRQLLGMGTLYAMAVIVAKLNHRASIILLERLGTPSDLGQFSVGIHVAELIWHLPAALGIVVFSRSANAKSGLEFSRRVAKLLRVTLVACLLAGLGIALVAPILIPLMYGNAFLPSIPIMQLMLPGVFMMVLFKVLNKDLAGKGRPYVALFAMLPALVVNATLGWILIPRYGGIGAAVASSASFATVTLVFVFAYSRIVSIPLSEIFRFRRSDFDFVPDLLAKLKLGRRRSG